MTTNTWTDDRLCAYLLELILSQDDGTAVISAGAPRGYARGTGSTPLRPGEGRLKRAERDGLIVASTMTERPWGTNPTSIITASKGHSHTWWYVQLTAKGMDIGRRERSRIVAEGLRASLAAPTTTEPDGRGF